MASIVPSQIVEYIAAAFDPVWFQPRSFSLGADGALAVVAGLLDLVDKVPGHLITLGRDDAAEFFASLAAVRLGIQKAQSIELQERQLLGIPSLKSICSTGHDPITVVRVCFEKCSDEAPHPNTPDFPFIDDEDLKMSLRSDLDQAWRALQNEQWKSAAVMSGPSSKPCYCGSFGPLGPRRWNDLSYPGN